LVLESDLLWGSEALDSEFDDVSGFEVLWRIESQTDYGRRAGGNDIAGQKRHEVAEVGDEEGDFENKICGGAVLCSSIAAPAWIEPDPPSAT
jgi:hypothetical protein